MNPRRKKLIFFLLRWGIAAFGIWYVVANMSLRDRVLVVDGATNLPYWASLERHADEDAPSFDIIDPHTKSVRTIDASEVINPASKQKLDVWLDKQTRGNAEILGMILRGDINHNPWVEKLLVKPLNGSPAKWIYPNEVVDGYRLDVPRPRVEVGIISMVQRANPWLLVASLAVFPVTFLITSYRWNKL